MKSCHWFLFKGFASAFHGVDCFVDVPIKVRFFFSKFHSRMLHLRNQLKSPNAPRRLVVVWSPVEAARISFRVPFILNWRGHGNACPGQWEAIHCNGENRPVVLYRLIGYVNLIMLVLVLCMTSLWLVIVMKLGCRVFSQDIPTDVVVRVGEANFSLHKVIRTMFRNFCHAWSS